jgi:hypothetical protein
VRRFSSAVAAISDWLSEILAVRVLRRAWAEQYHRDGEGVRRREGKDLPPARDRLSSPYDTDAHYGIKRGSGWCGYKVTPAGTAARLPQPTQSRD